jgi:hypothetical protein
MEVAVSKKVANRFGYLGEIHSLLLFEPFRKQALGAKWVVPLARSFLAFDAKVFLATLFFAKWTHAQIYITSQSSLGCFLIKSLTSF